MGRDSGRHGAALAPATSPPEKRNSSGNGRSTSMLDRTVELTSPEVPPAVDRAQGTDVRQGMAEVLEELLGRPVTESGHFFDDLGANSLLMAHFCAKLRKRDD